MDNLAVIISIIAPFMYVCLLVGFFIYVFRKKYNFQSILPIALISTTLFIFLFTLIFHKISVALLITGAGALSFIPLLILDKRRSRVLGDLFFTPGFVIFCIIYLFLVILDWYKVIPLLSDSSMHWAPHVWTMWLRDDFYTSPGSSFVIHGDYPPAIQLFELIWAKVAGMYHEGLLLISIQLLSFSMLFPVFKNFVWRHNKLKNWLMVLFSAATIVSLPLVFFVSDFYSSLEVDTILGFVFAYGIYLAITEAKQFTIMSLTKISLLISFLILTKQIAIVLATIVAILYLLGLYLTYRNHFKFKKLITQTTYLRLVRTNWRTLVTIALLCLLPLTLAKLWSIQVSGYESPDKGVAIFHLNPLDDVQIPALLTHSSGSEAQQYFSKGFVKHLLIDPSGFLINYIGSISYIQVVLLFIALMMIVWLMLKSKDSQRRIVILSIALVLGWFVYCFVIYSIFLFGGMNDIELKNLDTSNRYLRTFLFAMLLIIVMLIIKKVFDSYATNARSKAVPYFMIGVLVIFGIFLNKDIQNTLGLKSIAQHKEEFRSLNIPQTKMNLTKITRISNGTFEQPTKILVTAQSDKERHYLQYAALPNRITLLLFDEKLTWDSVCDKFRHNNYFVVGNDYLDRSDLAVIGTCLVSEYKFIKGDVYKIKPNGNKISLMKLQ